jgi:hypothetical protein
LQAIQDMNPQCADCNAPAPDWASVNLGVVVRGIAAAPSSFVRPTCEFIVAVH